MPRPANPETRSRLLEKGGELISTRGFNATGVQEITAAAGVPKGSFYNYFDSKEAFAVAVLSEYWEAVVAEYGAILDQRRTPLLSRIARYFAGLGRVSERRRYAVGCLIGNMALEVTPTSEDVRHQACGDLSRLVGRTRLMPARSAARKELPAGKDPGKLPSR